MARLPRVEKLPEVAPPQRSLLGAALPKLPRFVDLTRAYDPGLTQLLRRAGRQAGLKLRSGVYLAVSGPIYETPAEVRTVHVAVEVPERRYRQADQDLDFLNSYDARGLRLQMDYLKPELLLAQ